MRIKVGLLTTLILLIIVSFIIPSHASSVHNSQTRVVNPSGHQPITLSYGHRVTLSGVTTKKGVPSVQAYTYARSSTSIIIKKIKVREKLYRRQLPYGPWQLVRSRGAGGNDTDNVIEQLVYRIYRPEWTQYKKVSIHTFVIEYLDDNGRKRRTTTTITIVSIFGPLL